MCGIFGVIAGKEAELSPRSAGETITNLLELSESRGKEAAGLAFTAGEELAVFKQPQPASYLIRSPKYSELLQLAAPADSRPPYAIMGHARLVTNGAMEVNQNNQPVVKAGLAGIHNGIIVNDAELWQKYPDLKREFEVDTEVFLALLRRCLDGGMSAAKAVAETFKQISGAASVAILGQDLPYLILATNTGSLYYCRSFNREVTIFASEKYILEQLIKRQPQLAEYTITHLSAGSGCTIDLSSGQLTQFHFQDPSAVIQETSVAAPEKNIIDLSDTQGASAGLAQLPRLDAVRLEQAVNKFLPAIKNLRRCSRCVLPETMPFIEFDDAGVCNYCRNYQKMSVSGDQALKQFLEPYRNKAGEPDCLVTFSGGRDSSYSLHYLKKVLGLNPVAYSYDWGMLTDLGRRNQARMCGALGVEHILVSADIRRKRGYIRQNVLAWLKSPDLGTVPLFMAGDKQYFYFANKLKDQMRLPIIIFAENFLERTNFKYGFCGVRPQFNSENIHRLRLLNNLKMAWYYFKQFLKNPAYLNSSLFNTLTAFTSYYLIPHNYLYFYKYVPWDEQTINAALINDYNWEIARDTPTTWRIGDGTAAFYNFIYFIMAGFTENDTFRSNQIREGMMSREEAVRIVERDNLPRYESIQWYCDTIGIDANAALNTILNIPKKYKQDLHT
jgi:glucosamine--fructose-6-phosphate aminotransferase (isomerizing)